MKAFKIKTEEDYDYTLKLVESLMDAERDTIQLQLLDALTNALIKYENIHYPLK